MEYKMMCSNKKQVYKKLNMIFIENWHMIKNLKICQNMLC